MNHIPAFQQREGEDWNVIPLNFLEEEDLDSTTIPTENCFRNVTGQDLVSMKILPHLRYHKGFSDGRHFGDVWVEKEKSTEE